MPVLRNAQSLSLVEIERQIAEYATQARNGKLPLEALPVSYTHLFALFTDGRA